MTVLSTESYTSTPSSALEASSHSQWGSHPSSSSYFPVHILDTVRALAEVPNGDQYRILDTVRALAELPKGDLADMLGIGGFHPDCSAIMVWVVHYLWKLPVSCFI